MQKSLKQLVALLFTLAMIGAACGGEATDDAETGTTVQTDDTDAPDEPGTTEVTGDPGTTVAGDPGTTGTETAAGGTYDDPRGGIFADFQAGFDRSHPFSTLDSFCLPNEAEGELSDVEPGITADTIEIHQIRQELETLIDIGFGVEVGDVDAMFQAMVDEINNECGGIRGRKLNLTSSSYSPLDPDVESARIANCITATEDNNAAFVLNSSGLQGTAPLCVTEDHNTPIITTQGLEEDFYERGGGKLITGDFSLTDSLRVLVNSAHDEGLLEGKVIGVINADTPGQPEAVQAGLIDTLEGLGYEIAVHDTIGCNGGSTCDDGNIDSVSNMLNEGVDAFFGTLAVTSYPGYISEMVNQGFQPGEVQFFTSNFNSQAGDLVSSKIVAFGGEAAGNLYNGAYLVDSAATGNFQLDGAVLPRFNEMCIETYANQGGPTYDYFAVDGNTPQGMLATVCAQVRLAARAIYDAGDNPTRDDIAAAIAGLGPVDMNNMTPSSYGEGKYTSPDAAQTMTWTFPCQDGFEPYDDQNTCVVPNDDYQLVG